MARGWPILFSQVRGSIGDVVFYPNQHHSTVLRERVIPADTGSTDKTRWRTAFANSVSLWHSISQDDRDGWAAYGFTIRRWRRGCHLSYVGFSAFMQSTVYAWYARARGWLGADPIGTPPSIPGYLSQEPAELQSVSSGNTGVRFSVNQPNVETCLALYWESDHLSPSVNRYKSPWNRCNYFSRTHNNAIILQELGMTAGDVIFFKLVLVSAQEPFRRSMQSYYRGIATLTP